GPATSPMGPSPSQQVRARRACIRRLRKCEGRASSPAFDPHSINLDLCQRHFRDRTTPGLGPGRRAPLGLRSHCRQFLRLWCDGTSEELEAKLVMAVLVLVDDHAHMPTCL